MRKIFSLICMLAVLHLGSCAFGVDISQLFPVADFECMKNAGISYVIPRGYCSFGGMDHNAVQSLTNIKAAGLRADVYMFPCRGKNATAQANELVAGISATLYETIWIDVETNPSPGCSWSGHDSNSNCEFLMETISALKAKGKKVGVYASRYMWGTIFGSYTACGQAATNIPLWYPHYDNTPSFADFQPFGGWTAPKIKQYLGTSSLCNASVDRNWNP